METTKKRSASHIKFHPANFFRREILISQSPDNFSQALLMFEGSQRCLGYFSLRGFPKFYQWEGRDSLPFFFFENVSMILTRRGRKIYYGDLPHKINKSAPVIIPQNNACQEPK